MIQIARGETPTNRVFPRIVDLRLISILLIVTMFSAGCESREFTSEAFKFGEETGSKWRDLANEFEVFSTWIEEGTGENTEIPEVEKTSACRAMWIAIGWPKFGLKNMDENRTDFVDGCLSTIGR
jgi:hypothetical protein